LIVKTIKIMKGLGTALVTPFLENGEVDYPALGSLVEHQIAG
jgi:dihydrodipicolinate synthase/N-acetylneuraminate lyase